MGFVIYQASLNFKTLKRFKELFPEKRISVLRSYGLLTNEETLFCKTFRHLIDKLILDSGTFTLNFAKTDITVREQVRGFPCRRTGN